MASPERPKSDPKSPVVQESPVFTYLSNLSPLKPVQSRSGLQPYADTSCPTPDPVFTSPHFTRPRDPRLVKRLSDAEEVTSRHDDGVMAALPEDMVFVPSAAQLIQLVPCVPQRWSDDGPSEEQHCESPTTCVDTYLADPLDNSDVHPGFAEHNVNVVSLSPVHDVQVDISSSNDYQTECQSGGLVQDNHTSDAMKSATSTGLPNVKAHQVAAVSQDSWGDPSSTKEPTSELLVPNIRAPRNTTDSLTSASLNGTEMDVFEGPSFLVHMVDTENNIKIADKALEATETSLAVQLNPMPENAGIKADSDTVLSSEEQYDCISVDHKGKPSNSSFCSHGSVYHADGIQWNRSDYVPQLQPEPLQNIKPGINLLDDIIIDSCATVENHIPCDQEDCADHPRGMRKRLQFEVVESCQMSSDYQTDSWVFTNDVSNVDSPVTSLGMEPVNVSHKEPVATSGDEQLDRSVSESSLCRHSSRIDCSAQDTGSPPVSVPRALSIGLHLNSIGGPTNTNVNIPLPENCLGVQGDKFLSASNSWGSQYPIDHLASRSLTRSHSVKSGLSSDNFPYYSVAENSEEKLQEIETIVVPNSTHQSLLGINPLSSSMQLKPIDHHITPCSMKKRVSECANSTESTQRSPTKKMKRAAEKETCKRCNCKRSKCLKLYCECLASGVFCSEACACHDCYNNPEHEDTVQQTRQQIESRNPLAFVPKVVVHVTNHSKNTGDSERVTPDSARHKRGCNCKKSMCLKKYCECFQVGVGCSLGCRCDNCGNSFGRKGGGSEIYETEPESLNSAGFERGPSIGNLEGIKVKKGFPNNELCYSRLSPLTPQVQGTNGNDGDKFQLPAKYHPSPETGVSVSPPYEESPSSPTDTISSNIFAKETGLGCHTTVHEDFSPGWEGFPDICNFSPLSNISPQVSGASSSLQTKEPKIFHAKLFQGNVHLPIGPHCWRTSPVTPMPQMGERKFVIDPHSHSGPHNNHEDDTPEILKDSSSPIKVVNASSPSKKRVSPPHKHFHGMTSSSSPNLRSGRKFILQSVPAFPPLTPYHKNTKEHDT